MSIEIRDIRKSFGSFKVLKNLSLRIDSGELVALLGPSGSGKTTLLRILAGIESPDPGSGTIHFDDEDVGRLRAAERQVGFVFQHYALFRHMNVFENIAFGLRVRPKERRPSEVEIHDRVVKLLRLVQLEPMSRRFPSQLSGGQRQRVALARALAVEPRVLLLDEPFGALDAQVRKELRRWIRRLHNEIHLTSVFVTHDQEEALEVADRVVLMNEGCIEQIGTPQEVYDHPATPFVYHFLGNVNVLKGMLRGGFLQPGGLAIPTQIPPLKEDVGIHIYVRPHDLELARHPSDHTSNSGTVGHLHTAGPVVRVEIHPIGAAPSLEAELTHEQHRALKLRMGDTIHFRIRQLRAF